VTNALAYFGRYDTQHNDIKPNDTQRKIEHNDTQHNI
jgi:hypothetical protein